MSGFLYDNVSWGDTLCDDCRKCPADGLYETDPLCLSCANRRLDRHVAISLNRDIGEMLPPLLDRWTGKGYV